ncbi:hypothetical protein [Lewinella sp. JB7]|uniref:hypothetical protein n=1 Tax=Lewinella sp. JB7 TaxID=2962887 RepID=UPI0020C94E26|nr:hypothetical protein [Lewinella sp. JB7]MCP9237725.1 hypothetical protein [Lewinella sp. JB7]
MLPIRFLPLLFLFFTACGDPDAEVDNSVTSDPTTATDVAAHIQGVNERSVLDKDALKAMLPAKLLGMERQESSANSMGVGGFDIATASATYHTGDSGGRRITVTVSDGMGGNLANMGMVNSFTIDSEEGSKSTKTLQIDGHKAIRHFDQSSMNGTLAVIFDQSVVQIEGRRLNRMEDLESAFSELDVDDL